MELVARLPSEIVALDLLEGHVAIVTGGATKLGRAAAAEFARCGADVVIAGHSADALRAVAAAIGNRCTWVCGDIREAADCDRIVDVALERHGHVDTLLNNAGGRDVGAAEATSPADWGAIRRLNIDGTARMTHATVRRALRPGGGGMIASVVVPAQRHAGAAALGGSVRDAVETMTMDWAERWAGDAISAVAVALDRSDRGSSGRRVEDFTGADRRSPRSGRLAEALAFGWLAALVASPLGRSLSGSTITLDGGPGDWWEPWLPDAVVATHMPDGRDS